MGQRLVAGQLWAIGAVFPILVAINASFLSLDFAPLWVAGKQVLAGEAASIYDMTSAGVYAERFAHGGQTIFPYPPHAALLFAPFALMPYALAAFVWNVACLGLFYWAAKAYLPDDFPPILAVLTPGAIICVTFGQTGLLLGALWLLAFRGKWAAVALLTFKPHLGVLSILSIKSRADLANVALLTAAFMAVSIAVLGWQPWPNFIHHTIGHAEKLGHMPRWLFAGTTPAIGYGLMGWIPFAVAAGIILARRVDAFTAATASFLISPYGFHYDMPVVCLGFGLFAFRHWGDLTTPNRIAVALGFLSPVIALIGAWWVPPILLWGLWVQTSYACNSMANHVRSETGNVCVAPGVSISSK